MNVEVISQEYLPEMKDGIIYVGKYSEDNKYPGVYFRDVQKTAYYTAILVVEGGYYCALQLHKYTILDAYVQIQGYKQNGVVFTEIKHSIKTNYYTDDIFKLIDTAQEAIVELNDYLTSDWLENKPSVKIHLGARNLVRDKLFIINNKEYIKIVNPIQAKVLLVSGEKLQADNEIYQIRWED